MVYGKGCSFDGQGKEAFGDPVRHISKWNGLVYPNHSENY